METQIKNRKVGLLTGWKRYGYSLHEWDEPVLQPTVVDPGFFDTGGGSRIV